VNHKLRGRVLIHGDFLSPDAKIAEFSNDFSQSYMRELVAALNHGDDMLRIYKCHRDNLHITNVVPMLEHMERIFHAWEHDLHVARRIENDI